MSHSQINDQDRQRLTREVIEIIDALPHRAAITEGDVRHWVAEVVNNYGELAKWHAKRAGGFGGSQIGALVRNFHGLRADHEQSARKIVAGALLREVPEEPNGHMQRGIAMEASHREWFLRKYGAHRDVKGFETLSRSTGSRPWMRYSPDELAFMPSPVDAQDNVMRRWLGDYKAPGSVDKSDKVSFQYVAQLHMGRLVCEHNGVPIEGMILSQFDWSNWALKDDVIPYMPELDELIVQAGDHFWDFVLRGQLPPYVNKPRLENEKAVDSLIADDAHRLARLKVMENLISKEVKRIQESIVERVSTFRFGSSKMIAGDSLKISAVQVFDEDAVREAVPAEVLDTVPIKAPSTSRYDEDRLLARVRETLRPGEKMSQFYAPGRLDGGALYEAALGAGLDADSLVKEQLRMTATDDVKSSVESFLHREFSFLLHNEKEKAPAQAVAEGNREGQVEPRHVPRLENA
jgi:hypothetical protein